MSSDAARCALELSKLADTMFHFGKVIEAETPKIASALERIAESMASVDQTLIRIDERQEKRDAAKRAGLVAEGAELK